MKILGLPGINPATGSWMQQLLGSVDLGQSDIKIQQYQCWSRPGSGLNLEYEAEVSGQTAPDLVIAKSIGTRVVLYAFARELLQANGYVFIGVPLRGFSGDEILSLKNFCASVPVLLIQQTDDKAGSYSNLVSVITADATCKIVDVPGSDHVYSDIGLLKKIIESWHYETGIQVPE